MAIEILEYEMVKDEYLYSAVVKYTDGNGLVGYYGCEEEISNEEELKKLIEKHVKETQFVKASELDPKLLSIVKDNMFEMFFYGGNGEMTVEEFDEIDIPDQLWGYCIEYGAVCAGIASVINFAA